MEHRRKTSIPPGVIIDEKYRVDDIIGTGGMGEVYKATHIRIGRDVAIKRLHAEFLQDKDILGRFLREAQLAGSIGHDYICEVTDIGTAEDGSPYLVMPLLKGRSFADVLKEDRPLSLERLVRIICQTLSALEAAHNHEKKIVHRDLKPDNIFITTFGEQEEVVKLIDFGVAKVREKKTGAEMTAPGTVPGSLLGTPYYMSPEQAKGLPDIDHRVDIYAMGVILYEALTGERPFKGDSFQEVLVQILVESFVAPRSIDPTIPFEIEKIVFKAMKRDQEERYASAAEMSSALYAAYEKSHSQSDVMPDDEVTLVNDAVTSQLQSVQLTRGMKSISSWRRPFVMPFLIVLLLIAVASLVIGIWLNDWENRNTPVPQVPPAISPATHDSIIPSPMKTPEADIPVPSEDSVENRPEPSKGLAVKPKKKSVKSSRKTQVKQKGNGIIKGRTGTEFHDDYE